MFHSILVYHHDKVNSTGVVHRIKHGTIIKLTSKVISNERVALESLSELEMKYAGVTPTSD